MVDKSRIEEVKAIPIPRYLSEAVLDVAPSLEGVNFDLYLRNVCHCPVHHEKTPSFRWYEDTNTCYCFGCGFGGDIITAHRKILEVNEEVFVSFDDAVDYLYNRFIAGNEDFVKQVVVEQASKKWLNVFEHLVFNGVDKPANYELAEDLHLLVRLGKVSGEEAVAYYRQARV